MKPDSQTTLWKDDFFRTSDGLKLFYRIYRPAKISKTLIIFHGFGEHAHRYEKFSGYFPDYQIAIYDMRGMGQSEGEPVYVDEFMRYEKDAAEFLEFIEANYPASTPRILLGHSMGGLNLMRLWLDYQVSAEAYIFSAPCFRAAVPGAALKLNSLIHSLHPRFTYHNPVYYKNLTHDQFEMLSYRNDPWIMRRMTSRLLNEMVKAGESITSLEKIEFSKPVHFLLAGEDKLVRTKCAEAVFNRIHAPSKSLKIYKNFYHEIFNESRQDEVFLDLRQIFSAL